MVPTRAYAAHSAGAALTPYAFDRRTPGARDIQIDILYCGICRTDVHFVDNDWGMSRYPMVPGHEIIGRVRAVGAQVTKAAPGDLVGVGCLVDACRGCEACHAGLEQHCSNGFVLTYSGVERDGHTITQGGYSTAIVVDQHFVLRIADTATPERLAPLLCAGITVYSPLRRWSVEAGRRVAIVGLGGLGHLAVQLAASFGAEVSVLSTSKAKQADAMRFGAADFVVMTDAHRTSALAGQFDVILDTVGASHDYQQYLGYLRTGGTLCCLGLPSTPVSVSALNLVFERKCIAGSLIGGLAETQEMLDYCVRHGIAADVEVIAAQEINHAYQRLRNNDVKYRFVVDVVSLG